MKPTKANILSLVEALRKDGLPVARVVVTREGFEVFTAPPAPAHDPREPEPWG